MDPLLQTAIEAAHRAGEVLLRKLPQTRQVRYKGPRDIVTDADEAAQQMIAELIRERFPAHAFLGEEGGHGADLHGATPTWIVDPLDGTSNYARRFPSFCVSVGLAEAGAPRVGAIYDPARHETFYALAGHGAFLQRGRAGPVALRVSSTDNMTEALVGLDWARDPVLRGRSLAGLVRVAALCRSVRTTGSAALGLVYVAAGWLDAYYHLSLMPWDVAAAAIIIREAGGHLTTPAGAPWVLGEPAIVASNGKLHQAMVGALGLGNPT